MELNELLPALAVGENLSIEQAYNSADALASPDVAAELKSEFLVALAAKGESADEVAGLAKRFRELARNPGLDQWQPDAIDVCGTGGDKQRTFNISTTVTFVLVAAGIPVFKHGNKSITSQCGSANLLEALGVPLMADDATLQASMRELGFCFMFAPAFHPAFKAILPVRQALGQQGKRTVFNILGPLINPARPSYQVSGVFSASMVEVMAGALERVGLKGGYIVHCDLGERGGMDEMSVCGANILRGFGASASESEKFSASDFGLAAGPLDDLVGGGLDVNLEILAKLLDGKANKTLEDTIALSAAAAFRAVGRHATIRDGVAEARELLLGGAVKRKITQTKSFFESL